MSEIMVSVINDVYSHLVDEESRIIFNERLQFSIYGDRWVFYRKGEKYFSAQFDNFMKDKHDVPIVIYGAGKDGSVVSDLLITAGYDVRYFADSNRKLKGGIINGLEILSPEDLLELDEIYVIVIAASSHVNEIYEYVSLLLNHRDTVRNAISHYIFYPERRFFAGYLPDQYFDFFKAGDNEIFVDCGAYNAESSIKFSEWCGGRYGKIYLFEANPYNLDICERRLKEAGIADYQLIMKGVWDEETELSFNSNNLAGSSVSTEGDEVIPVTTIDQILNGERVTFIKMDIEGSEAEALFGASKTISKWAPKLAISAYHKMDDFLKLPILIRKLNPAYHIAFRHYTSFNEETVLYAWK